MMTNNVCSQKDESVAQGVADMSNLHNETARDGSVRRSEEGRA